MANQVRGHRDSSDRHRKGNEGFTRISQRLFSFTRKKLSDAKRGIISSRCLVCFYTRDIKNMSCFWWTVSFLKKKGKASPFLPTFRYRGWRWVGFYGKSAFHFLSGVFSRREKVPMRTVKVTMPRHSFSSKFDTRNFCWHSPVSKGHFTWKTRRVKWSLILLKKAWRERMGGGRHIHQEAVQAASPVRMMMRWELHFMHDKKEEEEIFLLFIIEERKGESRGVKVIITYIGVHFQCKRKFRRSHLLSRCPVLCVFGVCRACSFPSHPVSLLDGREKFFDEDNDDDFSLSLFGANGKTAWESTPREVTLWSFPLVMLRQQRNRVWRWMFFFP